MVDLDVVVHGDGPGARWAATTRPGDHIEAIGPRGKVALVEGAAWHLFAVTHPRADELLGALAGAGVQARGYYRRPLHEQPAMAPYVADLGPLPVTDMLARSNVALPISPVFSAEQAHEVVAAIAHAG